MSAIIGTLELKRTFAAAPAEVFAAWASADAMLAWSAPPDGWSMTCEAFRLEVGHTDRWVFGEDGDTPYVNLNRYTAIEPERRIVYETSLTRDGRALFAGAVCVAFAPDGAGCALTLQEVGLHLDEDDCAGHEAGWNGMLDALADHLAAATRRKAR